VTRLEDLPIRDDLRGHEPYGAPQLAVAVRLNTNENPYPPSPRLAAAVGAAVAAVAGTLNRYPDRDAAQLREDLASYLGHGLTARQVWAANGSNEIIQQVLQAFGGSGRTALGFEPSYSMHPIIARTTGTKWISEYRCGASGGSRGIPGGSGPPGSGVPPGSTVPPRASTAGRRGPGYPREARCPPGLAPRAAGARDAPGEHGVPPGQPSGGFRGVAPPGQHFGISADHAVEAVRRHRPDVVFLTSPNNPTGAALPLAVTEAVCAVAPGMVVVDEAYAEFGRDAAPDALTLLPDHPRLVVTRTMSKAFAMAGARLGYLAADPAVIEALMLVRLPYHLSAVTQAVARTALAHAAELLEAVGALRAERDATVAWLRDQGFTVSDSDANFVLFGEFADSRAVWQGLLDRGVLVREVGPPGWLRVSIGTPGEMAHFRRALRDVTMGGTRAGAATGTAVTARAEGGT
jgi:histidinol-phosphate/aromatic aminotransferase/cobyric acid decarboxylase-like protein